MSEDRKIFTDALQTLGTIIGPNEKRDAIHLAVIPIVAKEKLIVGQDVGPDGTGNNPVGIVDPFLKTKYVSPGETFWLIIYPRQITSLRHVWSHPAFKKEEDEFNLTEKEKSKAWMEDFIEDHISPGLQDSFMDDMKDYLDGKYETASSGESYMESFLMDDDYEEKMEKFWFHYETMTGTSVPEEKKHKKIFNCSC